MGDVGTLDFRENAPEKSFRDMYLDNVEGELIVDDKRSKIGHLASGVPGSVDGMVKIFEKFASVDWKNLLEPSIKVAKEWFYGNEKQAIGLNNVKESLLSVNDHSIPFVKDDQWKMGDILIQKS